MKKMLIVLALLTTVISCGKKQNTTEYVYAASMHRDYATYYYKGNFPVADFTFYKGVDAFVRMDSMCNVSRMYITRYIIAEESSIIADLENAFAYAEIGNCYEEMLITGFLQGDTIENTNNLEKPFSLIADFQRTGKYSSLEYYAESQIGTDDSSAVRIYRLIANSILDKEPKKAFELAEKARHIDSAYGWTLGLSRDLEIMIKSNAKQGKETSDLIERKKLIDAKLTKK